MAHLVVAQDEMKAWVWVRGAQDVAPGGDVLEGHEAVIHVQPLGIDLAFAGIMRAAEVTW